MFLTILDTSLLVNCLYLVSSSSADSLLLLLPGVTHSRSRSRRSGSPLPRSLAIPPHSSSLSPSSSFPFPLPLLLLQASYVTSYIYSSYHVLGFAKAIRYIVACPLPSLVSILYLKPIMLAKYLLVFSATEIDYEVLAWPTPMGEDLPVPHHLDIERRIQRGRRGR